MTALLRELAERWKVVPNVYGSAEETYRECADELLSILDAEGDGCAVTELIRTAPEQIYLQISDDESDHEEAFPADHGDEITWCADSVLDCEVKYIRSDLVTRHDSARSGGDGGAVGEVVSRESALAAIGHVERHNGPGRAKQAHEMLKPVTNPAQSGGVSDADVRGACRAFYGERWLRMEQEQPMRWMRAALTHFAKVAEVSGDAEDAARWRFLRNKAVDGFMRLSSGPSLNCDEPEREWDSWIDAARKGERHA
ncbi:MAG TPA: hypothetical protein VN731_10325 [Rhodanobacter sp.]|nr:hypothetical protein [Rhodanobacter sp.]